MGVRHDKLAVGHQHHASRRVEARSRALPVCKPLLAVARPRLTLCPPALGQLVALTHAARKLNTPGKSGALRRCARERFVGDVRADPRATSPTRWAAPHGQDLRGSPPALLSCARGGLPPRGMQPKCAWACVFAALRARSPRPLRPVRGRPGPRVRALRAAGRSVRRHVRPPPGGRRRACGTRPPARQWNSATHRPVVPGPGLPGGTCSVALDDSCGIPPLERRHSADRQRQHSRRARQPAPRADQWTTTSSTAGFRWVSPPAARAEPAQARGGFSVMFWWRWLVGPCAE